MRSKRQQIDPKTLRKASRRHQTGPKARIAGQRKKTRFGYYIEGYTGSEFETYFEAMAPNMTTDMVVHEAKTRCYRVLSGQCFVQLEKDGEHRQVVLIPGDELVIEEKITAQVYTSDSGGGVEFLVTQSAEYAKELNVLETSTTVANLDVDDLDSLSRDDLFAQHVSAPRSGRSKAREQQQAESISRGRGQAVPTQEGAVTFDQNFATNIAPSFGKNLPGAPG